MLRNKVKFCLVKSKKQLEQCEASIQSSSRRLTIEITKVYISEAWTLIDYRDFKVYTSSRLPDFNYDTLLHRARCGEVMLNIAGEEAVGKYSLNSMVPLLDLESNKQKQVFDWLKNEYGNDEIPSKWLTRKRVEGAIAFVLDDEARAKVNGSSNGNGHKASEGEAKWKEDREQFLKRLSCKPTSESFNKHLVQCVADTLPDKLAEKACCLIAEKAGLKLQLESVSEDMAGETKEKRSRKSRQRRTKKGHKK